MVLDEGENKDYGKWCILTPFNAIFGNCKLRDNSFLSFHTDKD